MCRHQALLPVETKSDGSSTPEHHSNKPMDLTKLPKNELISHMAEMLDSYTPKKQAKRNVALAMVVGMLLGLIA